MLPARHELTVAALDAEALGLGITTVLGRTYAFFMCHCRFTSPLAVDRGDFHLGVGLTMTHLADHAALLGTIGQDVELLALAGLDDLGNDLEAPSTTWSCRTLTEPSSPTARTVIEGDFAVVLSVQLLDVDDVADLTTLYCLPPVLITAYIVDNLISISLAGLVGRRTDKSTHLQMPIPCGSSILS